MLGTVSGPWASGHSCSRLQPRLNPKCCYWLTCGRQHLPRGPGRWFFYALFSPLIKVTVSYLFLSSQRHRKANPKIKKKNSVTNYLYPNLVSLSQLQVLTPHLFHLLLVSGAGVRGPWRAKTSFSRNGFYTVEQKIFHKSYFQICLRCHRPPISHFTNSRGAEELLPGNLLCLAGTQGQSCQWVWCLKNNLSQS